MLLKHALFAASTGAAAVAPSFQAKGHSGLRTTADVYNTINLDDFDLTVTNGTLDKRANWDWCAQTEAISKRQNNPNCVSLGVGIAGVIVSIASLIYTKSENHDCGYYSAVTDGAAYQVHATGSNCDTTAEQATIEGGLQTYFDAHGGDVCDVHCVRQTHGGTYTGYLLIAPEGVDVSNVVCDDSVDFPNDCGSGGKNDA